MAYAGQTRRRKHFAFKPPDQVQKRPMHMLLQQTCFGIHHRTDDARPRFRFQMPHKLRETGWLQHRVGIGQDCNGIVDLIKDAIDLRSLARLGGHLDQADRLTGYDAITNTAHRGIPGTAVDDHDLDAIGGIVQLAQVVEFAVNPLLLVEHRDDDCNRRAIGGRRGHGPALAGHTPQQQDVTEGRHPQHRGQREEQIKGDFHADRKH